MKSKIFPRLTININQINNHNKTERNFHKLSVPNLNNILQSFNSKSLEKKNKKLSIIVNNLKFLRKNTAPNILIKNLHFSNKNILNPKYLKLLNNKKLINTLKSTIKKGKNIDILKRYSVMVNKSFIKNKLNSINNKSNQLNRSSKVLTNKDVPKNKRYSTLTTTSRKDKRINPFEIEEEDKLFQKILNRKNKKKQKKKPILRSRDNPLSKVYKKMPYVLTELDEVKKLKNDMSLMNYQKTLLDVGGKVLNRELNDKLTQKFFEIRKSTETKIEYFENIIDDIEDKEKKIIKKINTQQNYFKKTMVDNNKGRWIYGMSNKVDFFPQIKFYPTPKYLLANYFLTD